ncbi:hypothetical protein BU590_11795 [Staphylococcus agnetis]|nr:hypothetical protein CD172_06135 [Staphylococcus agnetis]PTH26316.1 hypothetical protein BU590_11795 [Staphylococcus agnetis]PTH37996.1 hypothetical protein BU588_11700 [Staphylococcus agnetis]
MGYKSASLFPECSSNIQRKLIFITARNISSRFFEFKIKKSTKVDYDFYTRSDRTYKCALTVFK